MLDRPWFKLFRLFVFAVTVVISKAFQNCKHNQQSLSGKFKGKLFAIENNDKRNLTPAQRALQQTIRKEKSISEFDQFKKTIYSGVDTLQNLGKGKAAAESKVIDGYSERKAALLGKAEPSSTVSLFATGDKTQSIKDSPFDQIKGVFYGTLDFAGKAITNKPEASAEVPSKRVNSLPVLSVAEVSSKSSLLSPQVLAELEPRLRSGNIFSRLVAQVELVQLEGKERIRLQRLETQKKVEEVKDFVYSVVDSIKSFVDFVRSVPGEIQKAAESTARFAATIPETVEDAVETVQAIPVKAKETVEDIQNKVESTVSTTKQFVADVRDLPNTVQRKADETKQTITKVIETVNDGATSVKVLVGLEKPKPKPPSKPPPTPPKASDVVFKVAGFVLKTTGKATWWLGKTVGTAAYNAVVEKLDSNKQQTSSNAAEKGMTVKAEQSVQVKMATPALQKPTPPSSPVAKNKPLPPPTPPSNQSNASEDVKKSSLKAPPSPPKQAIVDKVDKKDSSTRRDLSSLDEEVRNALQQAAEALEGAERFKAKKKKETDK
ncbi:hypothetical protein FisN_3Hh190 [Fistulifera solaris]|jgi:hypothetical protein|uniref:Uncharacterized protein n=1 Tax=Fistulifera solaris TaxID=1519565 RepID=A0A1Z5JP85_FISSO|nr:hypothetical protein FisN_3Hh190 [Fistulifera solaris]|eukprot:GAX15716.1 hypothetical protein FisN_3Hh190 [Fistulifera solaris]